MLIAFGLFKSVSEPLKKVARKIVFEYNRLFSIEIVLGTRLSAKSIGLSKAGKSYEGSFLYNQSEGF